MRAEPLSAVTVHPARRVQGRLGVPGDKSISHRYAMLAGLADGRSIIERYAPGADCAATLACLRALGVAVVRSDDAGTLRIDGRGLQGLVEAAGPLDCENSGTTIRLLAGIVAAHCFVTTLSGDASLQRRPMRRVITPLELMGASIQSAADRPPLRIRGAVLRGIDFTPDVPSAQVKSAILLAGVQADGVTRVREGTPTRDHTELAFGAFGVEIGRDDGRVAVEGGQRLSGAHLRIPGDVSSAAFWLVAAAALPGSDLEIVDVGLNPTRTAVLDVLGEAGARVEVHVDDPSAGEPMGSVRMRSGSLQSISIDATRVPALIDELPALAMLAAYGVDVQVRGAGELRAKESDRIAGIVQAFRALGGDAEDYPDGFHLAGTRNLEGGAIESLGDHRLAMAFAIAGLGARGPTTIHGAEAVRVSYPEFFSTLESIVR